MHWKFSFLVIQPNKRLLPSRYKFTKLFNSTDRLLLQIHQYEVNNIPPDSEDRWKMKGFMVRYFFKPI